MMIKAEHNRIIVSISPNLSETANYGAETFADFIGPLTKTWLPKNLDPFCLGRTVDRITFPKNPLGNFI